MYITGERDRTCSFRDILNGIDGAITLQNIAAIGRGGGDPIVTEGAVFDEKSCDWH